MADSLLHQGATVLCQHGAQAQPVVTNPRVKVDGKPVATQSSSYTIAGCSYVVGSAPSPCVSAQWSSAAKRVKVGGVPVLLQNSQAICTPNGTGLKITQTQTRVKGQ